MTLNPYSDLPNSAFWSKSISPKFDISNLINSKHPLFKLGDRVASAGSCFASNLVPYIESAGLEYIRAEISPPVFEKLGENLGYPNFSAAYGNVYTARQLRQLYERALGEFAPKEDRWYLGSDVIDPFRPGLKYPASSDSEYEFLTNSHLRATRSAFEEADVFVFTLGLTEGWVSTMDGATYPACPGTIAGEFDSKKYVFNNFTVDEIVEDLSWFIEKLRNFNHKVRFVFSVSPVPLVATASGNHVLSATTYSKSVLRVAADEVCRNFKDATYFPAYELITGPQAPESFFESDKRNVSKSGVEFVMQAMIEASNLSKSTNRLLKRSANSSQAIEKLSELITTAECDEVMLDQSITKSES